MSTSELKARYLSMPVDRQARLLSMLALNLTVFARGSYADQVEDHVVASRLRAYNELQHTVTGQLAHLIQNDEKRYPDDVFVDVLLEKAEQGGCVGDLLQAFHYSCSVN